MFDYDEAMAVTPLEHPETVSVSDVLTRARELNDLAEQARREMFMTVAEFAGAHTTGALLPDLYGPLRMVHERPGDSHASQEWLDRWGADGADVMLELGGPGCPEVSDFAVTELAAALGRSTGSGRRLVGDAMEAKHRLPRVWARLEAGQVEVWRVQRIAQQTRDLSPDAAAFVDAHVAHVAHAVGLPTITRLVQEAAARFDPEQTEVDEAERRSRRFAHIGLAEDVLSIGEASAVHVEALLDRADAEELEAAVSNLAAQLLAGGSTDDLDIRRATAFGLLARGEWALPADRLADEPTSGGRGADVRRQIVLHVHLAAAALSGTPEIDPATGALGIHLARVENHRRTVTADAVRVWCGVPGTQVIVKPVTDLADSVSVEAYEIPDRIAERVRYQRPTCAFPHCHRPAGSSDLDHTVEWTDTGPPGQTSTDNLAPLCRKHHRAKTHPSPAGPSWHYRRLSAGTWLWTSPMGRRYLVHPDGTTAA